MTTLTRLTQLSLVAAMALAGAFSLGERGSALAQSPSVTVSAAWVREPGGSRKQTAVFAILENTTGARRAIVGGTAEAAETLELHEMKMQGAMMQMSPVKEIAIPAHGKTELKPGGLHIMLFGLKAQPKPGDTMKITLKLDDGTTVAVAAQVRKMDGM